jgi:hypothetical protein
MKAFEKFLFGGQVILDASESEGKWGDWLPRMGPDTFTGEFALHHADFWTWYWKMLQARKRGQKIAGDDLVYAAVWPRGGGKSSAVEWACIAEGALLNKGYVLYLSGTQALAEGHLQAIKNRLESSEISKWYPGLGNPKVGKFGQRFGWRQNMLITEGGWGIAALGADVGIRGGKLIDVRPTMIVVDDLDDIQDSFQLVQRKIEVLTRSVLPTGTGQTIVLFAQNLIHRHSVLNQMLTGKVKILSRRRMTAPVKALEGIEIEFSNGRDQIVAGKPTWSGLSLVACQKFLDDSGKDAFLAEYQHDFAASLEGLVIPEFDERIHLITWSEFERIYGIRTIPAHWKKDVGLDWGSSGYEAHPTAVSFFTTSGEDSALPGVHFLYKGLTFGTSVLVDTVGEAIQEAIGGRAGSEAERAYRRFRMSHEARSERDTLRIKYNIPFQAASAGKRDGIAQIRHYLQVDPNMLHPFKPDVWGKSFFYWIVEDDQLEVAKDDAGLSRWREEIIDWRWIPQEIHDTGITREMPVKFRDDAMDSMRMITQKWMPNMTPITGEQKKELEFPEALRKVNLPDDPLQRESWEQGRWLVGARLAKRRELLELQKVAKRGGYFGTSSS